MNAPNFSIQSRWTKPVSLFASLCLCAGLWSCDETKVTQGGSSDETSTIAFYQPNGKPAVGARVSIYGSSDTGVAPRKQVVTDAQGHANLPIPGKGFFNLMVRDQNGHAVFQDSLYSDGSSLPAASDTLHATGVLAGRLKVQSQQSPRIAWVQLMGAGVYANVDDSGRFRLEGIPPGKYTLGAYTRYLEYTPTFAKVRTFSDSTVDVGTIELIFTGLPR